MDFLEIIKYAIYAITGVAGWFIKLLWNGQKEMKEELETLRLKLAEEYTRKSDFKEAITDFKNDLRESNALLCEKINKIDDYLRDHSTK